MQRYQPPVDDIVEALDVVGIDDLGTDPALVRDLVRGFATFAAEVLAPLDRVGDTVGARHDPATNTVTMPPGFKEAYDKYVAGGWGGLAVPEEHGGGGFPQVVGTAADEIVSSANLSFSLNPLLTRGAIELLSRWGTAEQQAQWLPRLVSGEWTGTMNLTEPEAGSDVGALRTRAEPNDDGTWRITGSKIFITFGEHDLADNIVHLVLARTPGAPAGTRGISTFIVPKLLDADGPSPRRNAVTCVSIEHKLGIHASPTCVLEFDGAVGELVGAENNGMRAMFTMMNAARLAVAVQGIAIGEPSYQQALAYARERRQGRAPGAAGGGMSPIVEHPDVARMLLDMRSHNRAMRLLVLTVARATDLARAGTDDHTAARAQRTVELLTPIAKGWCTDTGVRQASTAIQVHGGMGFIEETGIAQRLRDSRIAPIYEGTNGIQAIDLVVRKIQADKGVAAGELVDDMRATLGVLEQRDDADASAVTHGLRHAVDALSASVDWLLGQEPGSPDTLAGATAFLELAGRTCGGWLLARRALHDAAGPDAWADARFFAEETLPGVVALAKVAVAGAGRLQGLT